MKQPLTRPLIAAAALLLAIAAAPSADAPFPGRNGAVAFLDDEGRGDIVGLPPGGRSPRPLISALPQPPNEFTFSPGGRLVAFGAVDPDDAQTFQIWIRPLGRRGPARRILPKPRHDSLEEHPDWSPDGQSIVFSRAVPVAPGQTSNKIVYVYRRGRVRPLSRGEEPTWSVRDEIAFVRPVRGVRHLYLIRPDGSQERKLPNTFDASEPDWSPRGDRIAFVTHSGHVATISRRGDRLRRVTGRSACSDGPPVFSPGGGQLAFWRQSTGRPCPQQGVVAARTNGTHLRTLHASDDFVVCCEVDWQTRPR